MKNFVKNHPDCVMFYCQTTKRHYQTLGYFGSNSVSCVDLFQVAELFAIEIDVAVSTVEMTVITSSNCYEGFKVIYSTEKNQKPLSKARERQNVIKFLRS